jgi:hypothetical protein
MATSAKVLRIHPDRWFFGGMALLIIALTLGGFAPTFFLRGLVEPRFPLRPVTMAAVLHGVAATAWLALFAAQVSLVSLRRLDIHRRLAGLGLVLTVAVFLTGIATVLTAIRNAGANERLAAGLLTALFEFALFLVLVLLALWARRDAQTHKRLMLFAAIGGALPSAIPRFGFEPPFFSGLIAVYTTIIPFILAIVVWDYVRFRKLQKGTLLGFGTVVAFYGAVVAVENTGWWLAFGSWTARSLAAV